MLAVILGISYALLKISLYFVSLPFKTLVCVCHFKYSTVKFLVLLVVFVRRISQVLESKSGSLRAKVEFFISRN